MTSKDPPLPYLNLANQLYAREIHENDLARFVLTLPELKQALIDSLQATAEINLLTRPHYSWAICQVMYEAAEKQKIALPLQAETAWNLARAASIWEQPQKLAVSVSHARQLFLALNLPGRVAACEWMAETIPLVHENYDQSLQRLIKAQAGLEQAGLEPEYFQCLYSTAIELNYLDRLEEAGVILDQCETYYSAHNEPIHLANCGRIRTRILTKQNQFEQAKEIGTKTREILRSLNDKVDLGKIDHALGTLTMYSTTNFEKTDCFLSESEEIARNCETSLSLADALLYRSMLYLQVGKLAQAGQFAFEAQKLFKKVHSKIREADCFTLLGLIEQEQGGLEKSIRYFKLAYQLRDKNQQLTLLGTDKFNLGNAYARIGRYQLALQNLEDAVELNNKLSYLSRIGLSEMYLARVWLQLKNYQNAFDHLDRAEEILKKSNQADSMVFIARMRARIYYESGKIEQALEFLRNALVITSQNNIPAQAALTERLLGEVLIQQTSFIEAKEHLQNAYTMFVQLKMQYESAYCLMAMGRVAFLTRDLKTAGDYFAKALTLSKGTYREIEWRVKSSLAEMEELEHKLDQAMAHYREAIHEINSIRSGLWQPTLAGSYAQDPQGVFGKAIPLAIAINQPAQALEFIEADKSITLLNQMSLPKQKRVSKSEKELLAIKTEIDLLQQKMTVNPDGNNSLQSILQLRNMRKDLQSKSRRYEALLSRLERKSSPSPMLGAVRPFSLERFREAVNTCCSAPWVAVDYYCTGEELILLVVTPDELLAIQTPATSRFEQALQACQKGPESPTAEDLTLLGEWLIPDEVSRRLTPETYLIFAPHRELHTLPWAILGKKPLVQQAIPLMIHSFRVFEEKISQAQLQTRSPAEKNGLLIGISQFNGLHPDLPFVKKEIDGLEPKIGRGGQVLREEQASLAILDQIGKNTDLKNAAPTGLGQYDWLHVASHFFSDPASGYLSGIALSSETLWLDQIRDLAPLPRLVTFSGCSSIFTRIYSGDEHIGLPSTCLVSGAQTVIGSVWSVMDEISARLMMQFYNYYLDGEHPARALALAQREIAQTNYARLDWGGFACLGLP